jgi:hypothetical protein
MRILPALIVGPLAIAIGTAVIVFRKQVARYYARQFYKQMGRSGKVFAESSTPAIYLPGGIGAVIIGGTILIGSIVRNL